MHSIIQKALSDESTRIEKGCRIPVLGQVVAGIPIEAIEEVLDWEEIIHSDLHRQVNSLVFRSKVIQCHQECKQVMSIKSNNSLMQNQVIL